MSMLIAIALKSLFIAGITLGLLRLMKRRSADERSWVAHIGLLALLVMAFAPLALPSWTVEAPALLGQAPIAQATAPEAQAFVEGYERIGYRHLPVDTLIQLKALNITPEFVRSAVGQGAALPRVNELVQMKLFGRRSSVGRH